MDRPTHSQARLKKAIVAALAALLSVLTAAAALAPAAFANAPADDEYVLQLHGTSSSSNDSPTVSATQGGTGSSGDPRLGVVGENGSPGSQLESLVSALGAVPGPLVAGLAALLALALLTALANRPRAREAE
jgi:hypothetical protein